METPSLSNHTLSQGVSTHHVIAHDYIVLLHQWPYNGQMDRRQLGV